MRKLALTMVFLLCLALPIVTSFDGDGDGGGWYDIGCQTNQGYVSPCPCVSDQWGNVPSYCYCDLDYSGSLSNQNCNGQTRQGVCGTEVYTCDCTSSYYFYDYYTQSCTNCRWEASGATECSPGSIDAQICGDGGTQVRDCYVGGGSCTWGEWSSCIGEGECTPGTTNSTFCGFGGKKTRTCLDNYRWDSWGECENEMEHENLDLGVYYCASDNTLSADLDSKDKQSCEAAGFIWTGTLCCSEEDDPEEFYNDPGGLGGCWNKTAVYTGTTLPNNNSIANFDGVFLGCNLDDESLLQLIDPTTQTPMIDNKETCFQDESRFYTCDENGEWKLSNGNDRSKLSNAMPEFNAEKMSACCSQDQCWDGNGCINNQADNQFSQTYEGYRCINGEWELKEDKCPPDAENCGFCPRSEQCFVSLYGVAADNDNIEGNPQCISDGQYLYDDYCENGQWTSRTKFIALQLFQFVDSTDFVLFCDNQQNTLNNLEYIANDQLINVGDLVRSRTNNFCVLVKGEDIIVGTSLDSPLNDDQELLDLIKLDGCDGSPNEGTSYISCSDDDLVWFDPGLNTLIYGNRPFIIGEANFWEVFMSVIRNPFTNMLNSISTLIEGPFDDSFVEGFSKFNQLYVSDVGGKTIMGAMEGGDYKNLILEYEGFDTDICSFVLQYGEKYSDDVSGIECSSIDNVDIVLAQGSYTTSLNPEAIWTDLTAKLRFS